eukprot:COSAG06_NODE_5561_length_3401_cov_2306.993640_2_plen_162_part_00
MRFVDFVCHFVMLRNPLGCSTIIWRRRTVRKTASFVEFFLCLSRACLGKTIVLMYKWLKKCLFFRSVTQCHGGARAANDAGGPRKRPGTRPAEGAPAASRSSSRRRWKRRRRWWRWWRWRCRGHRAAAQVQAGAGEARRGQGEAPGGAAGAEAGAKNGIFF